MHDINRTREAEHFLKWLKTVIIEKNADTLLVAGDVFDTVNPSLEARRLYYTFLASLVDTCCKNVIIVGGNHDSAVMLECAKDLLDVMNIHVVGSINNLEPADMCFELKDSQGQVQGICMALPFIRELELRNFLEKKESEVAGDKTEKVPDENLYSLSYKTIYDEVFKKAELLRNNRNIPVIATGHLYAADLEGRLRDKKSNEKTDDGMKVLDVLGTLGNVPSSVFPPADYIALGHIHYSTRVSGNDSIRYSGSPFVMGFDEADEAHYILCVDAEPSKYSEKKAGLSFEKIETPRTFIFKRLEGNLSEIKAGLLSLSRLEKDSQLLSKPLFIELSYFREAGENPREYLDEAIRSLPENMTVSSWKICEKAKIPSSSAFSDFDSAEIKNLDDRDIFRHLILSKTNLNPEEKGDKAKIEKYLNLFMEIADGIEKN